VASGRVPYWAPLPAADWFDLRQDVRTALAEMRLRRPSEVQAAAIPALLARGDVVIGAATGTGKTIAYLAPLVHALKEGEVGGGSAARTRRPRALIVVPTRELAEQVYRVAKAFSHVAKLRCVVLVGGTRQAVARASMDTAVDIVIATPGRLALLVSQHRVYLSDVRHIVLDEADTLVDARMGFMDELDSVLRGVRHAAGKYVSPRAAAASAARAAPPPPKSDGSPADSSDGDAAQIVLACATMTPAMRSRMTRLFPTARPLGLASLHRIPRAVKVAFVRVGAEPDAKHAALADALRQYVGDRAPAAGGAGGSGTAAGPRVLVFCNSVPSARSTAHFVAEAGYSAASLHGAIPPQLRATEFDAFASGAAAVLVCTDAAARGLHFDNLAAVILFDFPSNAVDFVHRVGRVGRAGRQGAAVAFVTRRDIPLANALEASHRGGDDAVGERGGRGSGDGSEEGRRTFTSSRPAPTRGASGGGARYSGGGGVARGGGVRPRGSGSARGGSGARPRSGGNVRSSALGGRQYTWRPAAGEAPSWTPRAPPLRRPGGDGRRDGPSPRRPWTSPEGGRRDGAGSRTGTSFRRSSSGDDGGGFSSRGSDRGASRGADRPFRSAGRSGDRNTSRSSSSSSGGGGGGDRSSSVRRDRPFRSSSSSGGGSANGGRRWEGGNSGRSGAPRS